MFAVWADDPHVAWLDSGGPVAPRSRYSYLAIEPFRVITAQGGVVRVGDQVREGDPFCVLQAELAQWRIEPAQMPVPFCGGAAGFFGYGLRCALEPVPTTHDDDLHVPDMVVGVYDVVIAFDLSERRAWIFSSGFPQTDTDARARRARLRQQHVLDRIQRACLPPVPWHLPPVSWTAELSSADYEARVSRVLDYIVQGDIFQANFTTRFIASRPRDVRAASIFGVLRKACPAPFAAYLGCGEQLAIASVSPERFVQLDRHGNIETRPIKGTRPRGKSAAHDAALRQELAISVKDRAENLMIADLMRNDIGRVAEMGTIAVPALCEVESFASVHHLVSVVTGRLRRGSDAVDLLRATFPGGSITGAPKIRAMEIIDELEVAARGVYCGAIGWIGFDGAMDSSIAIRTVSITPESMVASAGGGIVADSDPGDEYREMQVKIDPILCALGSLRQL